jgi:hypothetical protein
LQAISNNLEDLVETLKEFGGAEAEGWGSMIIIDEDIIEDGYSNTMMKRPGGILRVPDHEDLIFQARYLDFLEDQFKQKEVELMSEDEHKKQ